MSTAPTVKDDAVDNHRHGSPTPDPAHLISNADTTTLQEAPAPSPSPANYKGFVAGIFSGFAKLSVGHPFDTIKVRLQTSQRSHFKGPLDCVLQTVKNEGFRGLYKGATPPLVGWMFMDSLYDFVSVKIPTSHL